MPSMVSFLCTLDKQREQFYQCILQKDIHTVCVTCWLIQCTKKQHSQFQRLNISSSILIFHQQSLHLDLNLHSICVTRMKKTSSMINTTSLLKLHYTTHNLNHSLNVRQSLFSRFVWNVFFLNISSFYQRSSHKASNVCLHIL